MSNYYCKCRTNYFRVVDETSFYASMQVFGDRIQVVEQ